MLDWYLNHAMKLEEIAIKTVLSIVSTKFKYSESEPV